tara:strand:+ start:28 stop:876 length:849 start_codon:yes stop_codon:yes gene_type:complete
MDGLILNDWDFPVQEMDLWATSNLEGVPDIEVPRHIQRAIVRTDTNQVLGTVGKSYKIEKHEDVISSIFDAVNNANISKDYTSNIQVYDNGAKMKGSIMFNDMVIEPSVGDYIKFQVLFYNSYDGSWAVQQSAMGYRLFCKNGCADKDTIAKTVAKHTLNGDLKASASKIEHGAQRFFHNQARYRIWINTPVSDLVAETFFKAHICKMPSRTSEPRWNKKDLERLMTLWGQNKMEVGANKWALYNTCTYWSTHTQDFKAPANLTRARENIISKAMKIDFWNN